jgi:RNA polymerase subunit RPABC4/transcription elongation factor Spt4
MTNAPLSEEAFTALVGAGCPHCGGKKVSIEALVVQKLPLLGGEVFGAASWAYKGEDFVRGAYRIACHACKKELFTAEACPRCGAEGGVERALARENAFDLPRACERCGSEQFTARAFAPALVVYEGKRADKPRAQAVPGEPGCHAFHRECKACHATVEQRDPCPLCGVARAVTPPQS